MGQPLDHFVTQITPKALSRSAARASKIFALHKGAFLGQALPRLRRTEGKLEKAMQGCEPSLLPKLASALCNCIEQRRILLRIPSPGRDTPSEAKTIEMPAASAIDVQEIERMARDAERVVSESEQAPVSPTESAS